MDLPKSFVPIMRFVLGLGALAAPAAQAQRSYLEPFDKVRGLPQGPQLNTVSIYGGAYSLGLPASSGLPHDRLPLGGMAGGGASADAGWYWPGRRNRGFINYRADYDGNLRYTNLNGFSHFVNFELETKPTRSTSFSVAGSAESVLFSDFLFSPLGAAGAADAAQSLDDLSRALSGGLSTASLTQSPLSAALFGIRRRSGSLGTSFAYSPSPRVSWHATAVATRDLPAYVRDAGYRGAITYPAVTSGSFTGGVSYQVRPRTSIGLDLTHLREYSALERIWAGIASVNVNRIVGKQWFLRGEAGYGLLDQTGAPRPPRSPDYVLGAGIGRKTRTTTLLLAARRDLADQYGLGAENTTLATLAWNWMRPHGNWAVDANIGYQRLTYSHGIGMRRLDGWLYQATLTRRLTGPFSAAADLVYASDSGQYGSGTNILIRRAARLGLVWSPGLGRLQ